MAAGLMPTRYLPFGWQIEDWWRSILAWCGIKQVAGGKAIEAAAEGTSTLGAGAAAGKAIGKAVEAVEFAPAHWRRSADYFIERARRAGSRYERILYRDLILAVRCAAECRSLQRPTLQPLRPAAGDLRGWNGRVRFSVLREAAHCVHHLQLRDRLEELTWDEDDWVRGSAARALSSVGGERAVRERLLELTRDEQPLVGGSAASALSEAAPAIALLDALSKLAGHFDDAAAALETLLQKAERLAQERGMTLEQYLDSV